MSILGLEQDIVRLLPYQAEWAQLFEEEKRRIEEAVGRYILDIQHVGSTSIQGIPAKPIIDIGIAVENFEEAVVCIKPMVQLGYIYRGENGIPRRHFFRKGNGNQPRTHHVHMNEIHGVVWQNQILFRDYLRRHPETAEQYARLKIALSNQFQNDRLRYLDGKASFIQGVLRAARKTIV